MTLVTCGEIVLDFDVIDSRDNEFETINKRKKGEAPFYPDSFIQLLGSEYCNDLMEIEYCNDLMEISFRPYSF